MYDGVELDEMVKIVKGVGCLDGKSFRVVYNRLVKCGFVIADLSEHMVNYFLVKYGSRVVRVEVHEGLGEFCVYVPVKLGREDSFVLFEFNNLKAQGWE